MNNNVVSIPSIDSTNHRLAFHAMTGSTHCLLQSPTSISSFPTLIPSELRLYRNMRGKTSIHQLFGLIVTAITYKNLRDIENHYRFKSMHRELRHKFRFLLANFRQGTATSVRPAMMMDYGAAAHSPCFQPFNHISVYISYH